MDKQASIINDLAIRIANLEVEKAGIIADLKQAQAEITDLKNTEKEDAE